MNATERLAKLKDISAGMRAIDPEGFDAAQSTVRKNLRRILGLRVVHSKPTTTTPRPSGDVK